MDINSVPGPEQSGVKKNPPTDDFDNLDLSDPVVIQDMENYLEEVVSEDEEYMETLITMLPEIEESAPCAEVSGYSHTKFTEDESKRIRKNWKNFVKRFNLPNEPIKLARYRNFKTRSREHSSEVERVRTAIALYLAQGLNRQSKYVFDHFVIMYAYPVKGSYSPGEQKVAEYFTETYKTALAVKYLSIILRRRPRQIYNVVNNINRGPRVPVTPEKWTLKKADKFLKYLMKYSKLPLNQLKYREFHSDVWLRLAAKIQNNVINLRRFWYSKLHVQLFVQRDIKLSKIRKKLFLLLKNSSYKKWSDIKWKDMERQFPDGVTSMFIYTLAMRSFRNHEHLLKGPLVDALDHAMKKNCKKNKRLKRLCVNDEGNLQYLH